MHYIVLAALLTACALADVQEQYYSFSESVGTGSGRSYRLVGQEKITALRVWEANNNFIYGFQFRYGYIWSEVAGYQSGDSVEMELYDDEAIIEVCGKYSHHLMTVEFITNKGRKLRAGQPSGRSFNFFPSHRMAELRFVSGRYSGGITSFQVHWGVAPSNYTALL